MAEEAHDAHADVSPDAGVDREGDVSCLFAGDRRRTLLASSIAISAPEFPTPTRSTGPSASCDGFRYSYECICTIDVSRSAANGGTLGCWKFAIATTTLSASNVRSPAVTTNRSPRRVRLSTRVLVRTGRWKRSA